MPCAHTHTHDAPRRVRDADPSGTAPISEAWRTDVRARLARAQRRIETYVEANEGIGITRRGIEQIVNKTMGGEWYKRYLNQSYKSGIDRAAETLGLDVPKGLNRADRAAIGAIAKEVTGEFKDVSKELAKQLAGLVREAATLEEALAAVGDRVAAIGIARGSAVAAVNTIAANADATLSYLEEQGIEEVGIVAEKELSVIWQTAEDDDVCPACEALEGRSFSLEEASGMIPLHPNCRCAWIPLDFSIVFEGAQKK